VPSGFQDEGDVVYLVGVSAERDGTDDVITGAPHELAGSEYLRQFHGLVAGAPRIDLALEARVQRVLVEAAAEGLLRSAHDCSHGGLAVTLAEACLANGIGFATDRVRFRGRRDAALFGEAPSRVVVSVDESNVGAFQSLLARIEVPAVRLGLTGGDRLHIVTNIDASLDQLRIAYETGLEEALREPDR
jgi:phosphoribosylformylglycinamidine synthase